jgi:hypothetical protein
MAFSLSFMRLRIKTGKSSQLHAGCSQKQQKLKIKKIAEGGQIKE